MPDLLILRLPPVTLRTFDRSKRLPKTCPSFIKLA